MHNENVILMQSHFWFWYPATRSLITRWLERVKLPTKDLADNHLSSLHARATAEQNPPAVTCALAPSHIYMWWLSAALDSSWLACEDTQKSIHSKNRWLSAHKERQPWNCN